MGPPRSRSRQQRVRRSKLAMLHAMCCTRVLERTLAIVVWLAACASGCESAGLGNLPEVDAGLICSHCNGCAEALPIEGRPVHVTGPVNYTQVPPVGGPHHSCWSDWGVFDAEVPPERWVHNLEHGGVVLLYHCDDCETELEQLRAFVGAHARTLLSPYAQLPTRFAAVAWGHRMLSDCYDPASWQTFYETRVARAPESIAEPPPPYCARSPEL